LQKEFFFSRIPKTDIGELDKSRWGNPEIVKANNEDKKLQNFIRRIRNALSHARCEEIEINNKNYVNFQDKKDYRSPIDFEVNYSVEELKKFVFRFARAIMFDQWAD
jgi:hypothetical protein